MSDFFVLPEALMMNIWLGLPIKSSVRFRCVSKSWCAFLSDPHFIYKNLTLSDVAANEHDRLLLVNLETPHYSVVSPGITPTATTPLQVPPEVPIPDSNFSPDVLTPPCDDMVCFYDHYERSTSVWNLTTGETKVLPRPVLEEESRFSFVTLGFGFDERTKEYKIVQILYHYMVNCVGYVYTLSGSSNGWRKVGEPNMPFHDDDDGAYYPVAVYSRSYRDGTFYWGSLNLIVSFDMSTEVFITISVPFLDVPASGIESICKLKEGSMLMIKYYYKSPKYEMWALLELGVTQSWTKLSVIDWGGEEDEPLGFWRNEVVLKSESNGRLIITDPFKREIREIQLDEPVDISSCVVWTKGKKAATTSLLSGLQG